MEINLWTAVAVLTGMLVGAAGLYAWFLRSLDELIAERDAEIRRQVVRAIRAREGKS